MTSAAMLRWPEGETVAVAEAALRETAPREARSTRAETFAEGLSTVPESFPEACRRPRMAAVGAGAAYTHTRMLNSNGDFRYVC